MEFCPPDFVVFNDVSEGGACHGCSCKAFPVEVVDDEVPKLEGKVLSLLFFFLVPGRRSRKRAVE